MAPSPGPLSRGGLLLAHAAALLLLARAASPSALRAQGLFKLVAQTDAARAPGVSPGRLCPASVTHVAVGAYTQVFRDDPARAVDGVRFLDLNVSGGGCTSSVRESITVLTPQDPSPGGTPVDLANPYFLRGEDLAARRCARYTASLPARYLFTDDLPLFRARLQREGLLPPGEVLPAARAGTVYMLSRQVSRGDAVVQDDIVCTYVGAVSLAAQPSASPSPGASPSAAPPALAEDDGGSACFPADARVSVAVRAGGGGVWRERGGRRYEARRMDELRICDAVASADGWSEVFFFSHRDPAPRMRFVTLSARTSPGLPGFARRNGTCAAGDRRVTVSPGHYVWTGRGLVEARNVRVGTDVLLLEGGGEARVVGKERTVARGLYAPHTLSGSMYVDGVLASCYTSAVPPGVAGVLLLPIRMMYTFLGLAVEDVLDHGNVIGKPVVVRIHSHCAAEGRGWLFRSVVCQFLRLPSETQ